MTYARKALIFALFAPLASMAADSDARTESHVSLTSVSKSMPALTAAVSAGAEKACVPTHLTISGSAVGGTRLYVSALVGQFSSEVRKSARAGARLTREQAHEIQRLVSYAEQAQKNALGFPPEALERFSAASGLKVQANLVCLSMETASARESSSNVAP